MMTHDIVGYLFIALIISVLVVLFSGDPDIADGWRCHVLEIPMEECRSPKE